MSSRLWLNISLFFAIIILVLSIVISQQDNKDSSNSSQDIKTIHSISIHYDNTQIELVKNETHWTIINPIIIDADDFRIKTILSLISSLPEKHYEISADDLVKYSLNPALATLTLNKQQYLFGTTSAIDKKRYLYSEGKLYLVDDTFFPLITSGYKNLLRRQLFPANTKIQAIRFNTLSISQDSNGSWKSTQHPDASSDKLKRFIDNWLHIQAYAVFDTKSIAQGTEVTLSSAEKQYQFIVSKSDSGTTVYSKEHNLSYQLDITAYESLLDIDQYLNQE